MTTNEVLSAVNDIAKAIKLKNGSSDQFYGKDFEDKILEIDRLQPMNVIDPTSGFDNGYIGLEVAKCARSYIETRYLSNSPVIWNYNSNGGPLDRDQSNNYCLRGLPVKDSQTGKGKGNLIDCSTFVLFVLHGLDFENSPYNMISGDVWNPSNSSSGLIQLTKNYGKSWAQSFLDYQPEGTGKDIGTTFQNKKYGSIRNAADLAEIYYKRGLVVYDRRIDGDIPLSDNYAYLSSKLLPGDLIFWSRSTATENQKKRFRSISHVAISSENPEYVYEATTLYHTLYYRKIAPTESKPKGRNVDEISLIIRPDYRPIQNQTYTIPQNENLLTFPWTFSRINSEDKSPPASTNGLWFKMVNKNTIGLCGINTAECNESLIGSTSLSYNKTTLTPGTYDISLSHDSNTDYLNGLSLQVLYAGTAYYVRLRSDGSVFSLNDVLSMADNERSSYRTIRAYQTANDYSSNTSSSFSVNSGNTVDICVRLHIGSNNGSGYAFGSLQQNEKIYTNISFNLKRTS